MLWWKRRQLHSSQPSARIAAAAELASAGDRKAVPALVECLTSENREVREAAARALGILKHPASAEPLAAALERACSGGGRAPGGRSGPDARECEAIALAVANLESYAGPPLIPLLGAESKDTRRWAARALGLARHAAAVDPLLRHLADARSDVRKEAAIALGHIGDPKAAAALMTALNHKDPETRRAAADALGEIRAVEAVEKLQAACSDSSEAVQVAAVTALGRIGGLKAAAALRLALDGSSRKGVKEAAGGALDKIEVTPTSAHERATLAVLKGDFTAALQEGSQAVMPLLEALASRDPGCRALAAQTLASLGSPDTVKPLARALRDVDRTVQAAAATALAAVGNPAVDELLLALGEADPSVQRFAAEALGNIGNPLAAPALAEVIATNQDFAQDYMNPLDAARAAADALLKLLEASAIDISFEALEKIAALPDIGVVRDLDRSGRADATGSSCGRIRGLAVAELTRRRTAIQA
jgi:HEAT repeat protein